MSFALAFVLLLGAACSEGQVQNTTDPAAWPSTRCGRCQMSRNAQVKYPIIAHRAISGKLFEMFSPFYMARTVCYQLGGASKTCFSNRAPFNNANGKVPKSPSNIGTTFNLKTRSGDTIVTEELSIGSLALETKDTKIIVHGFFDSQNAAWVNELINAFLDMGDFNVIVVDWSEGAKPTLRPINGYYQSVANTRLVGAQVAFFVEALEQETQIPESSVHIIGHSLGAHIAGYAGKRLTGLGRITGLDPAGPAFMTGDSEIRISPTDAAFVDVLHTDCGVFGLTEPVGTADFYPNTGKQQPGCEAKDSHRGFFDLIKDVTTKTACSHSRAISLFIESVKGTCQYQGYPCAPGAVCNDCGEKVFGLTEPVGTADFYPNTGKQQPGCEAKDSHRGFFDLIKDVTTKTACSHSRAISLFIESVKGTCQYQGYPCAPGAVCNDCGEKGCARMGYHSAVDKASGSYYSSTTATAPFC